MPDWRGLYHATLPPMKYDFEFIETEFMIPWEDVFIPELVPAVMSTIANFTDWELRIQISADAARAFDLINSN